MTLLESSEHLRNTIKSQFEPVVISFSGCFYPPRQLVLPARSSVSVVAGWKQGGEVENSPQLTQLTAASVGAGGAKNLRRAHALTSLVRTTGGKGAGGGLLATRRIPAELAVTSTLEGLFCLRTSVA